MEGPKVAHVGIRLRYKIETLIEAESHWYLRSPIELDLATADRVVFY